ncbi:Uncharacterised protein [BD1-7 clade bacterium]|uniref:DNA repair protein n=1 Tax=BD1-7 clade bacterium TaxID=2029982 RepID=A0A5S9PS88_9GAMM|nr:Uncharacterised protein [BD1-7 clade bacterium]
MADIDSQANNTGSADARTSQVESAVAEGGAYEVIRKRLLDQANQLEQYTAELNTTRLHEFGQTGMALEARVRVRTEHNCVARDIVQVGRYLVFGYNVFIGLKKEIRVEDVFSLFTLNDSKDGHALEQSPLTGSFLADASFVNDFDELYRYYKHTRLVQLTVKDGKLLAGFQIGERIDDIRVFRWQVSADGETVTYIDNRGERDIQLPPAFDFEWHETGRDDSVHGRHPHINILDQVFVETINGDLTIKVEDNTEDGLGIYREPVDDKTQSLDDADIAYASVGDLILLRILPYRETASRYFIFNPINQQVTRCDQVGESCIQLPEDHGVIFPGGYYLQTGEFKRFDEDLNGFNFKRMIRSPNGEDVLYVFYNRETGACALFPYNLIEKQLSTPILGHGYALAEDGTLVIFTAEDEPTRIHPMQVWQTPYQSAEFAAQAPTNQSWWGSIGNAALVRGISDFYSITRMIRADYVSLKQYELLNSQARKLFDAHYWLDSEQTNQLSTVIGKITDTAELVIDEFEKVESIRRQSAEAMQQAQSTQADIIRSIQPDNWESPEEYVKALAAIRKHRGHLATARDYRYIDLESIETLDNTLVTQEADLSQKTVEFLSQDAAFIAYESRISELDAHIKQAGTIVELTPPLEAMDTAAEGLDLLSELMATLKVDDANLRTGIIDAISTIYAKLNQSRAAARIRQKELGSAESRAQFAAQFKLLSQSVTNALSLATTPEKCDEQLSRLLVQLEELESQFSDHDDFLADIMDKREEIYEALEGHKQQLLDERQRKAQHVADAAKRILASIEKRSQSFSEADALNTYFASDSLVQKARAMSDQLRALDASVKADDLDSRYAAIREQALRSLRDKSDIFEDGGSVIKLGPRHKFSVNTQELDLTIIPRDGGLCVHLVGTDYYEPIVNDELLSLNAYWDLAFVSETESVYRAEYLAASILYDAEVGKNDLTMAHLERAMLDDEALDNLVRDYAAPRYKEGYQKGIHDHDASLILKALLPAMDHADLLRFDPSSRAFAQVFWAYESTDSTLDVDTWPARCQAATAMQAAFGSQDAVALMIDTIEQAMKAFAGDSALHGDASLIRQSASYLAAELAREQPAFILSQYARQLVDELKRSLDSLQWKQYETALVRVKTDPQQAWDLTQAWVSAMISAKAADSTIVAASRYCDEAVAYLLVAQQLSMRETEVDVEITVSGLLGDHPRVDSQQLHLAVDEFLQRIHHHRTVTIPGYHRYLALRAQVINDERDSLKLESFKARPLSSFVRNRLINESYLPLIGDNLAKQMGTVGEKKRSDLMGLLMMISPPGYGKTTLMEYVANRLGLIFMKINCPSLGHHVVSLDPAQAPDATSRQELEKLNLALEMGNNVMLYLDDIQHTNPEFLQKFISLCDGTRKVDGVWRGQTKTYDMRGRKFCVVMAGNPYTESGEVFKIPDMLANRADIYNLGDILGGTEEAFALSYVENSLTSNPVLAPLALREMQDVYQLVDMAKGREVASTDLSHAYSGAELNEITDVLRKMFIVQDIVLKINQAYIASAAQDDKYRTEPSFKLQGSYRNMNKMTEKITSVMSDDELQQMIDDHYQGESQLLTNGAESNLLKLAELRGTLSGEGSERWQTIKGDFQRNIAMGGDDTDVGNKVVAQLVDLVNGVRQLADIQGQQVDTGVTTDSAEIEDSATDLTKLIEALPKQLAIDPRSLQNMAKVMARQPDIKVVNEPVPGINQVLNVLADTIEGSLLPLVHTMDRKLDIDLKNHEKMKSISQQLMELKDQINA